MTESDVEYYLSRTPPGLNHPVLSKDEASVRAKAVFEDLKAIGLELEIKTFLAPLAPGSSVEIAYYDLPMSDYGKASQDEKGSAERTTIGLGYTWGDLFQLSKACMNGRRLVPRLWPQQFQKDLLTNRHYSCVQELLWLGRFRAPIGVTHSAKAFPGCPKDVDWRFTSNSQVINLEVKYRPADWMKLVDGPTLSPSRIEDFQDVIGKFPIRNAGELNLLAVTTMAALDESLDGACRELLKEIPALDGIFVWSHAPMNGYTRIISDQVGFLRMFFNEGDEEDRIFIPAILHQWAHTAMRQGKMPGEVNQAMEDRFKSENWSLDSSHSHPLDQP